MTDIKRYKQVRGPERKRLGADLREQYEAGISIRALAAQSGRSYGFVRNLLTETGVSMRGRGLPKQTAQAR